MRNLISPQRHGVTEFYLNLCTEFSVSLWFYDLFNSGSKLFTFHYSLFPKSVAFSWRDGAITTALIVTATGVVRATALRVVTSLGATLRTTAVGAAIGAAALRGATPHFSSLGGGNLLCSSVSPTQLSHLVQLVAGIFTRSLSKQLQRCDCRTSQIVLVRLRVVE